MRVASAFSEGRGEGCVWRASKDLIFFSKNQKKIKKEDAVESFLGLVCGPGLWNSLWNCLWNSLWNCLWNCLWTVCRLLCGCVCRLVCGFVCRVLCGCVCRLVCGSGLWTFAVASFLGLVCGLGEVTFLSARDSIKKIKSFEALQTQPSPLPSEKAATTHNASATTQLKQ